MTRSPSRGDMITGSCEPTDRRRRMHRIRFAALALTALLALAACSEKEPEDPAEAAEQRMRERLEQTFSDDQADCIVGELDDETIDRLLADDHLRDRDVELWTYSGAVRDCVIAEVVEIEPPPEDGSAPDGDDTPPDENNGA